MSVLKEVIPFTYNFTEATNEQKRRGVLGVVEGVFQKADVENANKRIYPRELWEKILKTPEVVDRLENRAMVGELDHPQSGATAISRISHVVTKNELRPDGTIFGRAEILDTPMGRIAETLFRAGVRLGVSSRGDGTVKEEGGKAYVNKDDFRLETYDFVLKPSTPGAYPALTEEEQTREDKTILEAVEGLVNESEDPRVLLESVKLLSYLKGTPSERHEAISRSVQDKLVRIYEAVRPPETHKLKPVMQEAPMQDKNATLDLSQVESLARDLAAKKIAEQAAEYDRKLADKDRQIAEATAALLQTRKEYKAAESLVEELLRKVEDVKQTAYKEGSADATRRYEAAAKLLAECLRRLRPLNEQAKKYHAAKELLVVLQEKMVDDRVLAAIDRVLSQVPSAQKQRVFNMLRECRSVRAVNQMWESIKALGFRIYEDTRQPLPTQGRPQGTLVAAPQDMKPCSMGSYLTERLVEKAAQKVAG